MKVFKPLFILSLSSILIFGSKNSYGSTSDDIFCSRGAQDIMDGLQAANQEKFEKIERYKGDIKKLEIYNDTLADVGKIKKNYLEAIKAASEPPPQPPVAPPELSEKGLAPLKTILREGMNLMGINAVLDGYKNEATCKEEKYKNNPLCKTLPLVGAETPMVGETLKNFQKALAALPDADQVRLKKEIKEKLAMDEKLLPENVLPILLANAPKTTALLTEKFPKETLLACFNNESYSATEAACKVVLKDPTKRDEIIDLALKEANEVSIKLGLYKDLAKAEDEEREKSEMEKAIGDYLANRPQATAGIQNVAGKLFQLLPRSISSLVPVASRAKPMRPRGLTRTVGIPENLDTPITGLDQLESLDDGERFFYTKLTPEELAKLGLDENNSAHKGEIARQEIDKAKKSAADFAKYCSFSQKPDPKNPPASSQLKACGDVLQKFFDRFEELGTAHRLEIGKIKNSIQGIAASADFAAAENLKKYVAEKYLCVCAKNRDDISFSKKNVNMVAASCQTQFMELNQIDGLKDSTTSIAKILYAKEIKIPMNNNKCGHSLNDLDSFQKTCVENQDSPNMAKYYEKTCKSVITEYNAKKKEPKKPKQEETDWVKKNEENWVSYDRYDKDHVSITKKKSTMRIVSEGLVPAIPSVLPIWFANYQTKQTISDLTNQALMQEQMMHNNEFYANSPWMYNPAYFLYSNTGTSTTTGAGFNFGF